VPRDLLSRADTLSCLQYFRKKTGAAKETDQSVPSMPRITGFLVEGSKVISALCTVPQVQGSWYHAYIGLVSSDMAHL